MGLLTKDDATPDVPAMQIAAQELGIDIPDSEDPEELVQALREGFAVRLKGIPKDDWIVCPACGEFTDDTDDIEACPFCGDDGEDENPEDAEDAEDTPQAVDAADLDPVDEDAPKEPPVANLDDPEESEDHPGEDEDAEEDLDTDTPEHDDEKAAAKSTAIVPASDAATMATALDREKRLIKKAQTNIVRGGYHMGESLLRIHKGELWKAEGHKTFRKFLDTISVSSTMAYDMMGLVESFDEKTFMEVGRKRLLIVAKADKKDQKKLLDKARDPKTTRRDLEKEAKGSKPNVPKKETRVKTPPKEDQITLLAKVGGRPKSYRFTERKTKAALKTWTADSYVEIKISDTVTQFLGLRIDDAENITGITVAFTRVENDKAKAKSNGKANGATATKAAAKKTSKKRTTRKKRKKKKAAAVATANK